MIRGLVVTIDAARGGKKGFAQTGEHREPHRAVGQTVGVAIIGCRGIEPGVAARRQADAAKAATRAGNPKRAVRLVHDRAGLGCDGFDFALIGPIAGIVAPQHVESVAEAGENQRGIFARVGKGDERGREPHERLQGFAIEFHQPEVRCDECAIGAGADIPNHVGRGLDAFPPGVGALGELTRSQSVEALDRKGVEHAV